MLGRRSSGRPALGIEHPPAPLVKPHQLHLAVLPEPSPRGLARGRLDSRRSRPVLRGRRQILNGSRHEQLDKHLLKLPELPLGLRRERQDGFRGGDWHGRELCAPASSRSNHERGLSTVRTRIRASELRPALRPLASLAQTNVDSLKEYDYFTYARADGKSEVCGADRLLARL